jgi:hypothetical protein
VGPVAFSTSAFAATASNTLTYSATDDAYTSIARVNLKTGGADKLVVSEWGVFDYAADPSQKATIYAKVLEQLKALPAIKGLMYFDAANAPGAPGDLRVDSSAPALTEFKKIAADPIFNVKVN